MNKQQAAEFLNVGVRSLERYMSQGRIAYIRQRGKTGETVVFENAELERFNAELHEPIHQGAIEQVRHSSPSNGSQMVTNSEIMAGIGESLINISEGIDALLESIKELAYKVPVQTKPLLTLREAQQFSGLSRRFLLSAINDHKLKAEIIGKSWRVKRLDLERFIRKLF